MGYGCKAYGSWTNSAKDEFEWTPPYERTSDGGNGNHSVSLPIILLKNKVDQMLPSS